MGAPLEYEARSQCEAMCNGVTECQFMVWGWNPLENYYRCATFTSCATRSAYQDGDSSVFAKSHGTGSTTTAPPAPTLAPTPAPSESPTPVPTPAPAPMECDSCQACMANNNVCYPGTTKSWCALYPQYTWCGHRRLTAMASHGSLRRGGAPHTACVLSHTSLCRLYRFSTGCVLQSCALGLRGNTSGSSCLSTAPQP